MKKCFRCKLILPLFCFSKNNRSYQLKWDKGRNISCLKCNYNFIKNNMYYWYFSNKENKFLRKAFSNKIEIVKHLIKTYNETN